MSDFLSTPHHINAISSDLAGNNNIGRYIFLPGSEGRAKTIASHFDNVTVKQHSRGHHLYLH
jgi:uridine phosphorylase